MVTIQLVSIWVHFQNWQFSTQQFQEKNSYFNLFQKIGFQLFRRNIVARLPIVTMTIVLPRPTLFQLAHFANCYYDHGVAPPTLFFLDRLPIVTMTIALPRPTLFQLAPLPIVTMTIVLLRPTLFQLAHFPIATMTMCGAGTPAGVLWIFSH